MSCKHTLDTVDFSKVSAGKQLSMAKEIYPNDLMELWILNTDRKSPYNLRKLYEDSIFLYFGRYFYSKEKKKQNPVLFKIEKDTLKSFYPNYESIRGWEIRKEFYKQIVPKQDKKRWESRPLTSAHR